MTLYWACAIAVICILAATGVVFTSIDRRTDVAPHDRHLPLRHRCGRRRELHRGDNDLKASWTKHLSAHPTTTSRRHQGPTP
jgi:hypothetical protein